MVRAVRHERLARRMAVAAAAALTALGTVLAAPASAAHTIAAGSKPTIGIGQVNQAAGDITITWPTPVMLPIGHTIVLTLDDADPGPNCGAPNPTTDFVAFTALPTVTVTPSGAGAAMITPSLTPLGGCLATKTDQLTLLVATAGTISKLTLSNVRYDVGTTGTAIGDVQVAVTGSAPLPAPLTISNAFVTSASLSSNNPPVGIRTGSGAAAVGNLVVTERVNDALAGASANVCIVPTGGFDTGAPGPSVAVAGGTGDTATVTVLAGGIVRVAVADAPADTGASTLTISGLRLSAATTGVAGLKTADLSVDTTANCTTLGTTLTSMSPLAAVVTTDRLSGGDRYETAQALFEAAFPCAPASGLASAVIARGDDFPDALAASYLAGSLGTGILLVDSTSATVPTATVNALRNRGVDKVFIIGGTTAIPPALATALDNLPNYDCAGVPSGTIDLERIGGADRYETGRLVAERPGLGVAGTADYDGTAADPDGPACAPRKTAIVATGVNFPDALVAGPVAFNGHNMPGAGSAVPPGTPGCGDGLGFPLILTTGNALHPQASQALTNLGIQQVLIMGGASAIDPSVETAIQGIGGITTKRFAGTNRLDTAKQFGEFAIDFLGYSRTQVSVARGDTFPDALAGAPHAAATPANVIVITENAGTIGAETLAFFGERQGTPGVYGAPTSLDVVTQLFAYGGTTALADGTVNGILARISQA